MSFLTAVIATRNDPLLGQTVNQISPFCPVIIINDAGDEHIGSSDPQVKVWDNQYRLGPGPSRQRGGSMVLEGWIMFCDSHMQFPKDWYAQVETYLLSSRVEEIWGPVYHSDVIFDSMWHDSHFIGGADFYFWRHEKKTSKFTFMDLLPRRKLHGWSYSVPCLLGGCYFVHSSWFEQMDGYKALIGYGCEEQWLSLSTWLMGGAVNIMGKLAVTHIYQHPAKGNWPLIPEWEANRIAVLKRILPPDQYLELLSWLPIKEQTKTEVDMRCSWINQAKDKLDIAQVCRSFSLQTFDEAIEIMKQHKEDFAQ